MLYFTLEVFHRLANQSHGHICVMLQSDFDLATFSGGYLPGSVLADLYVLDAVFSRVLEALAIFHPVVAGEGVGSD